MTLRGPTQMAETLFQATQALFDQVEHKQGYRLIGAGLSQLHRDTYADRTPDLLDPTAAQRATIERARDEIRKKFGSDAIIKGRSLR